MSTEWKVREFRAEIMEKINGIESLVEKENCEHQSLLISCLKLVDKFLNEKNYLSL